MAEISEKLFAVAGSLASRSLPRLRSAREQRKEEEGLRSAPRGGPRKNPLGSLARLISSSINDEVFTASASDQLSTDP